MKTGKNGIGPISKFDVSETGVTLAAEVKDFPMEKYFVKKDGKRMDKFSLFGIYAALEAMAMSGLDTSQLDVDRFGVMVGSGIGGLETIQNQVIRMHDKGPERVAPLFIPMAIGNMVAGNIALRVGAKGICTSTVTACASATHSIGKRSAISNMATPMSLLLVEQKRLLQKSVFQDLLLDRFNKGD